MVVAAVMAGAGPAAADGYCGADPTGATACPVSSNTTLSGSLASSSTEADFYVFYVAHQTDLQLTITDTEDASCSVIGVAGSTYPYYCGSVTASLLDGRGNDLADLPCSSPTNGVTVPESITKTIGPGVYYVEVSGSYCGQGNNPPTIPYQLTVAGNPWGAQWPPPPPPPAVERTPVPTPLPLPPAPHALHVKVVLSWTWRYGVTRLDKVRIATFPGDTRLTLRCLGRGCPRVAIASAVGTRGVRRLVRAWEGMRFRAGDRLLVTLTAPGYLPERAELLMRFANLPRVRLL
jgi:hypothetical protein